MTMAPKTMESRNQELKDYLIAEGLSYLLGDTGTKESVVYNSHIFLCLSYAAAWDNFVRSYATVDLSGSKHFFSKHFDLYDEQQRRVRLINIYRLRGDFGDDMKEMVCQSIGFGCRETWNDFFAKMGNWNDTILLSIVFAFYHLREAGKTRNNDDAEGKLALYLYRRIATYPQWILFLLASGTMCEVPRVLSAVIGLMDQEYSGSLAHPAIFYLLIREGLLSNLKVLLSDQHIAKKALLRSRALIIAVRCAQMEISKLLLDKGFDPNQVEIAGSRKGWSALGLAIRQNNYPMCSLLLHYGADVHQPDDRGRTLSCARLRICEIIQRVVA
ncbi:hypothetical protein F5Y16DRAFT_379216 [Xylariaceae sp. FL0255]|nr:hypothetical protein F5Y16DRAFT_379216 [Xylariaceae sp. FL0255]